MIKGRSALESLQLYGLANDGPLNTGGLGAKPVIEGVTTADKLVRTPKPMKKAKAVNKPEVLTPEPANKPNVNNDRKAYMKAYMAKKRAELKAKQ